jgi:hypothetical protein
MQETGAPIRCDRIVRGSRELETLGVEQGEDQIDAQADGHGEAEKRLKHHILLQARVRALA